MAAVLAAERAVAARAARAPAEREEREAGMAMAGGQPPERRRDIAVSKV